MGVVTSLQQYRKRLKMLQHYYYVRDNNAYCNVLYGSITRKWKRSDSETMPCTLRSLLMTTNR